MRESSTKAELGLEKGAVTHHEHFYDDDHFHTLGHVRLRDATTNEIILTPAPSLDPNDPLKWLVRDLSVEGLHHVFFSNSGITARKQWYKILIAILVAFAMVMCNFMAAGPTVTMLTVAESFNTTPAHASFFFNNSALAQGVGNLFWVPVMLKYGRRPVYIASFLMYFFMIIGSGASKSYGAEIVTRLLLGFAGGAGECLAPLTITDIFFLHERGLFMAAYNASLSGGVAFGSVTSGLIVINYTWRTIYWVGAALVGATLLVVIFFFPETAFERYNNPLVVSPDQTPKSAEGETEQIQNDVAVPPKKSYWQNVKPWDGRKYTNEPLWRMMVRPLGLIILPPVFWATIVMSVTIGFLVAISSNIGSAFSASYGMEPWQIGLCYIGNLLGCAFGIVLGGPFSDWIADYFTKRNGGIREPEMRLPAIALTIIASPLSLILYGVGIQNQLHWMVPTLGLFFSEFVRCFTSSNLLFANDA
jgi:MFS family permease